MAASKCPRELQGWDLRPGLPELSGLPDGGQDFVDEGTCFEADPWDVRVSGRNDKPRIRGMKVRQAGWKSKVGVSQRK